MQTSSLVLMRLTSDAPMVDDPIDWCQYDLPTMDDWLSMARIASENCYSVDHLLDDGGLDDLLVHVVVVVVELACHGVEPYQRQRSTRHHRLDGAAH
jgi:hypothetical protein